jgi:hypothetical protein
MLQTTINWNQAIILDKQIQVDKVIQNEQIKQQQAEYLTEFLESDFGILDSSDIHHYSEMTGKSANELRRMHPNKNEINLVYSFMNDETDDIFNFF